MKREIRMRPERDGPVGHRRRSPDGQKGVEVVAQSVKRFRCSCEDLNSNLKAGQAETGGSLGLSLQPGQSSQVSVLHAHRETLPPKIRWREMKKGI